MWEELTDLTFDQWVYHIFDHPDTWYSAIGSEYWAGPTATTVAYMTRLFEDPIPPLEGFTDEELNRGFWYLVSNGGSDMMFAVNDQSVPLADRLRCINSFSTLFERLFLPRCTPYLSHLDEKGVAPLNSICYMWWDLNPAGGDDINEAIVGVMERELALDHPALQEGALHGLGHWERFYLTEQVDAVIDAYIARNPNLRPELLTYARSARGGCVL